VATETDLCNMALSHLGVPPIVNLKEGSTASDLCNLFYETTRDFVLQDHDWNFAERRRKGELSDFDPSDVGYSYAYRYPSDCLKVRRIQQPVKGGPKIEFTIFSKPTLEDSVIATDEQNPIIIYTATMREVNSFSAAFRTAFSWNMAGNLAFPLTKNLGIQSAVLSAYQLFIGSAKSTDSSETNENLKETGRYIKAR